MKSLLPTKKLGVLFALSIPLILASCNEDDPNPQNLPTGNSEEYTLFALSGSGVSGSANFEELDNGSTRITLNLNGTSATGNHPAHIHFNTAAETGGIAVSLSSVEGSSGTSITEVTTLDDGSAISYSELINFDGYINVHESADNLSVLLSQGDIGQNELTGSSESYELTEKGGSGLNGQVTFSERENGETLVVIELTGDDENSDHPTHIHENTAAESGAIAISLSNVKNGVSITNVTEFDDGTQVSYSELTDYDGYINVHREAEDLSILAQGDVGQNVLTGNSKTYELAAKDVPGISGLVTFSERKNGTTLVSLELEGTSEDGKHPAHIHDNDAATGGGIAISLKEVDGSTGRSDTQIESTDSRESITYEGLLEFNGYINVHLSETELSTIVAQGNIGANEDKPSESAINYDISNSGASAYIFNGNGLNDASNPNLTLKRGTTYTFTVNSPGHPFYLKTVQSTGSGDAYDDGVTNNGAATGTVTFVVPSNAPGTLFYICEFHSSMTGTITITD